MMVGARGRLRLTGSAGSGVLNSHTFSKYVCASVACECVCV